MRDAHSRRHKPLEVGLDSTATPECVWTILTDTHQWPRWGPSVREVLATDRYIGPGSKGQVVIRGLGVRVGFRVTTFEPPYRWHWSVARLPATGHRVDPLPDGGARVVFELPRWAFAYAPVCREACRRIIDIAERSH